MTRDFTPEAYRELLEALAHKDGLVLRHDVDLRPDRSVAIAKIEAEMGYKAAYYFRVEEIRNNNRPIEEVRDLGHRIGYHYECLTTCEGDFEKGYDDFRRNLESLRRIAEVTTACAHGSPKSKYNNQDLWKKYDYHTLGIKFEPMMDTDFSKTLYLTDTGRKWDGYNVAVRDKVPVYQKIWKHEGLSFHSTQDIIKSLQNQNHTIQKYDLLINTHPQRWIPFGQEWIKEFLIQNGKNIVKGIFVLRAKTKG